MLETISRAGVVYTHSRTFEINLLLGTVFFENVA